HVVSSTGRSFMNGKALSKELRSLIIDEIISKEGNTLNDQFNGSYSAIARSVDVSHVAVAKVWPQFCIKPDNTNITFTPEIAVVNGSVTITCNSEGLPEPSYSIIHNGTEVSTNKTYTIDDVQYRHAGIYTCIAMNKRGKDSASANLTVIEKPNVTINCPSPITVNESDAFTCVCRGGGGNPPAILTWYKDGEQTGNASYGENSLTRTSVTKDDIGTYKCVARRYNLTDEKTIEVKARLNFKPNNTKITFTPEEVKVGTSVNITCYSEGRPEPRYNITHNRIVLSTGKTHTISKANLSDAGTYECIAWNKLGNDSASAYLTVEVKPENTKITITQEGVLDSPVTITCSSEGRPEPSYNITHNGTRLRAGRMYTIPKVKWSNAGTYKCIAKNKLGRDSAFAYLTFEGNTYDNTDNGTTVVVWHIVVTLVSGFILGILFSYIASCSRRRWFNNRKPERNSEPKTTEVDTTYQELDLSKMNTEDNYQSLSVNAASNDVANDDDSTYTQLSKTRDVEDNYQSLT
ncbi:B-cell receptor CD22-like isoform X1, partial [Paramuricea clavata]